MLKNISKENIKQEKEILKNLFSNIDNYQSTLFNAGAGAGKTYALIECLKYIIKKYEKELKIHNRKIICITYTNVAAKEIKERLGNTELIKVSTIHERIWELIKIYQKELVEIHLENIKIEIKKIEEKIEIKKEYRDKILEIKGNFYSNENLKSKEYRKKMEQLGIPDGLLKNVNNFKILAKNIIKVENYKLCIQKIEKNEYKEITYDPLYNSDRLYKMRISHDTLLKYGYLIIEKYSLLRKLIIDQYPYIFIDEYQDTDEKIVKIMNLLDIESKRINNPVFIGYFGDYVQNIYENGVGRIENDHLELKKINKIYNRRSYSEIIEVANKIRNDEVNQKSIYTDSFGGNVEFYKGSKEKLEEFLRKNKRIYNTTKNKPLHCLLLTNRMIASFAGFEKLYEFFSKSEYYSGVNYNQLNTEFLSNEAEKMGEIPRLLYRIMRFKNKIENSSTFLKEIIIIKELHERNIVQLRELINLFSLQKVETFLEYIDLICKIYDETNNNDYKVIIGKIFDIKEISAQGIRSYLLESLYPNLEDKTEKIIEIDDILKENINEYENWFDYIEDNIKSDIIYHTYHGTKGLEFENVIVVMENNFGRDKDYFKRFFKYYNKRDKLDENDREKFEKARNLLYVSVTRAIKNLKIFYVDDISELEDEIKKIFGEIKIF